MFAGARRTTLPTYAFQRERYWQSAPTRATGGSGQVGHPLLGDALPLAGHDGAAVFTGELSLRSQPWLADHAVLGTVLLPGTAFVDMALHVAQQCDSTTVEDLTLQAPLVIPSDQDVQIQVAVGTPDDSGRRTVTFHSRTGTDSPWRQHAAGTVAVDAKPAEAFGPDVAWPPHDAVEVDVSELYETLAEQGYHYGPAFQGLRSVWRHGTDVLAEVQLPTTALPDSESFGVHPALLDASLHALNAAGLTMGAEPGRMALPFSFTGVSLAAAGLPELRVRWSSGADGTVSLFATDPAGQPAVSIGSLLVREVPADQMSALRADPGGALYQVQWTAFDGAPVAPADLSWASVGVCRDDVARRPAGRPVPGPGKPDPRRRQRRRGARRRDPPRHLRRPGARPGPRGGTRRVGDRAAEPARRPLPGHEAGAADRRIGRSTGGGRARPGRLGAVRAPRADHRGAGRRCRRETRHRRRPHQGRTRRRTTARHPPGRTVRAPVDPGDGPRRCGRAVALRRHGADHRRHRRSWFTARPASGARARGATPASAEPARPGCRIGRRPPCRARRSRGRGDDCRLRRGRPRRGGRR